MKNIKFELTENKKSWNGITLYQIKATTNFVTNSGIEVNAGQLGGWVKKEENLSQEGSAWVWSNAKVYGTSKVYGDAEVYGNAIICGNAIIYGSNICGTAQICDDAKIGGNAEIWTAQVYGNKTFAATQEVYDNAEVWGAARIGGDAKVLVIQKSTATEHLGR